MNKFLAVTIIAAFMGTAWCQIDYQSPCDPLGNDYHQDSSAPTMHSENGFEVFMQIPVYLLLEQNVIEDFLPEILKYPLNETVFLRVYSDQKGRGAMYGAANHDMFGIVYDTDRLESMAIDYQSGNCDVKPMVFDEEFPWGYFHGHKKFIHIPLPEKLLDLKQFKIKRLENLLMYRGFHNVQRYEACLNLHDFIVHLLEEVDIIDIPDLIIDAVPDAVAIRLQWYFADSSWEMEDGQYAVTGPVPLAVDLYTAWSETLTKPPWYFDVAANATMTAANYHSHYPEHDVYKDLMQVPPGIYCERNKTKDDPEMPTFPRQFHVKSESLLLSNNSLVYNTEDFYDYNNQKFRFDLTLHIPDTDGPTVVQLFHDYANNVAYEINKSDRTCKQTTLSPDASHDWDDNPISHMLLRPYDLFDLSDINPSYIGVKHCRGMACHFWAGKKDLKMLSDGKPTYGVFGVWATTSKWGQNFTASNPSSKHFITELDVQVFTKDKDKPVGRNHIQIFDFYEITSDDDAFFTAPTKAFCGSSGEAEKPKIPWRYQYRGEYSEQKWNASTPIFLNFDVDWNVVRFDWTPLGFNEHWDKSINYRESYVYDLRSGTNYQINKVNGTCNTRHTSANYVGQDNDALELLWPPRVHQHVSDNILYIGVLPCRRKECDSFEVVENDDDRINIYEYQFTTTSFTEISIENPAAVVKSPLARIGRHRIGSDGMVEPNHLKSVDIFGFTDQKSIYWEYEIVAPCFVDVDSKWIQIPFTADSTDVSQYIHSDYFRVEMMDAIRQNASNISPIRIADLTSKIDDLTVTVEFKLRDRHPNEQYPTPSLDDAINSLTTGISGGAFTVQIVIPASDSSSAEKQFSLTAATTLKQRDQPFNVDTSPVVRMDVGALAGTIVGSVLGGVLIVVIIASFAISKKHNVPVKSLYVGDVPGTGVSHDLPSVSMGGGISVSNEKGGE